MRILFCAGPATGHILPMVPLAEAAREAGHEVALLSGGGASAAAAVPGYEVFEVGPSVPEALEETAKRLDGDNGTQAGPGTVELFGGVRLDGHGADLVRTARQFGPDLVVYELTDTTGPLVAAALGVPSAKHQLSGPLPPELMDAIAERAQTEYQSLGVVPQPPIATIDPFPELLLDEAERDFPATRIALRPQPHREGPVAHLPELPGPVALVTFGTSVQEPEALASLVTSIAEAGVSALVTAEELDVPDAVRDRVRAIGFVPLAQLLPMVDVVVSAGGSGTMLAALSEGKPQVIRPFVADQPWNADRMARFGLGVAIEDVTTAGETVRKVLADDSYRRAAGEVAGQLAEIDDAPRVLELLLDRLRRG